MVLDFASNAPASCLSSSSPSSATLSTTEIPCLLGGSAVARGESSSSWTAAESHRLSSLVLDLRGLSPPLSSSWTAAAACLFSAATTESAPPAPDPALTLPSELLCSHRSSRSGNRAAASSRPPLARAPSSWIPDVSLLASRSAAPSAASLALPLLPDDARRRFELLRLGSGWVAVVCGFWFDRHFCLGALPRPHRWFFLWLMVGVLE